MKFCFDLYNSYQQKHQLKHCVIVCATRSDINSANLWPLGVRVTLDTLQHEIYNVIYGIVAFHDY